MRKVIFVLSVLMTAKVANAQGAAPSPNYKSGSLTCAMFNEQRETFTLAADLGDWRLEGGYSQRATLRVRAPDREGLSGDYEVSSMNSSSWWITHRGTEKDKWKTGQMSVGYRPDGTIMIETFDNNGADRERFVGFCNYAFSGETKALPQ